MYAKDKYNIQILACTYGTINVNTTVLCYNLQKLQILYCYNNATTKLTNY